MNKPVTKTDRGAWYLPEPGKGVPEAGYEAWLAEEIAAGTAELDAGLGVSAVEVWRGVGVGGV